MTAGDKSKLRGALYGLAFGDAWGWPTEFHDFERIRLMRPDFPKPAIITDDTQMSLYVLRTVLQDLGFAHSNIKQLAGASNEFNVNEVRIQFANSLQDWLFDPDNNRAPGNTCIEALMNLEDKYLTTGLEGTIEFSKGNGANIRCPWLGLLRMPERMIENLAVLQASVTHNHPLALAGAAVTSLLVKRIYHGEIQPGSGALYTAAVTLTDELIDNGPDSNLGENYQQGLVALSAYLHGAAAQVSAFHASDDLSDISAILGPGNTAEEALLNAIAVTDHYHTLPMAGIRRLAHSSGDSDSTAAIAGAMLGAHAGDGAWPVAWYGYLEPRYQQELAEIFEQLLTHVYPAGQPQTRHLVHPANLHHMVGDMFTTLQPALGHGVNTHGVMGAGVARVVRAKYPEVYEVYRQACKTTPPTLVPGGMLPVEAADGTWVLNLASQQRPGADARLDWLTTALHTAFTFCAQQQLTGFAIPRIGAGIGGLDWADVEKVLIAAAGAHPAIELEIWTLPNS